MNVLVATSRTQGAVEGDYCWTVDGELVLSGAIEECCSPDRCGCGRGFPGLASCRATTTATVVEQPGIDRVLLAEAIRDSLDRQGWLCGLLPEEIEGFIDEEIRLIERITARFPVGAVLVRSGRQVSQRTSAAA
jgi:hypothetical protein